MSVGPVTLRAQPLAVSLIQRFELEQSLIQASLVAPDSTKNSSTQQQSSLSGATPLVELLEHPELRQFGRNKRDTLPRYCRECEVLRLCNGGCPKDRFIQTPDGEAGLNYLCAGLKKFFSYSAPYLQKMAVARQSPEAMERFMQQLRSEDTQAARQAGRNDLCPCGSGRKYKKCCLGKLSA